MTNKHTPGPWAANIKGTFYHKTDVSFYNGIICQFDSKEEGYLLALDDETIKANARLIAAAPELLKALEDLVGQADKSYKEIEGCSMVLGVFLDNARAAIAKAKGE